MEKYEVVITDWSGRATVRDQDNDRQICSCDRTSDALHIAQVLNGFHTLVSAVKS